jgi:hypothetical protein
MTDEATPARAGKQDDLNDAQRALPRVSLLPRTFLGARP